MLLDEMMEQVAKIIGDVLADCLQNKKFEAPVYITAIASNGTAQIYRCEHGEAGGLQMSMLSEHDEALGFKTPINFFVTDRTGRAARLLLEDTGRRKLQVLR